MRVAAEVNMWEMLVSADSPTLHRHRAHTRRASKREEWECEQKKKEEPKG